MTNIESFYEEIDVRANFGMMTHVLKFIGCSSLQIVAIIMGDSAGSSSF